MISIPTFIAGFIVGAITGALFVLLRFARNIVHAQNMITHFENKATRTEAEFSEYIAAQTIKRCHNADKLN